MAIARIQMRRGNEQDYDPAKMMPGEWAVSLDTKYVRMCFAPGECLRMATYEAFEQDMAEIMRILAECRDIRTAVELIRDNVAEAELVIEDYVAQAKQYRDEAFATTPDGYADLVQNVADNTFKIDTIIEKAELNIKNTANGETIHLTDSADSKVLEFGLHGKAEQNGTPTSDAPVDIEVAGASGSVEVKSVGKNKLKNTATTQNVKGVTFTVNADKSVTVNGTPSGDADCVIGAFETVADVSYIFSGCPSGGSRDSYFIGFTNIGNDFGNGLKYSNAEEKETVAFIRICSGQTVNNLTFYPMIRLASDTDDTYEPYKETTATISTPDGIAGINGVYDEIVKYADGSGKRIQRIGKAVFDGSDDELWDVITTDTANAYRMVARVLQEKIKKNPANDSLVNILCSQLIQKTPSNTYRCIEGVAVGVDGALIIYNSDFNTSDVSLWKAHLQAHPMTVLYELAEPIITDLTAEEIAEIEKLYTFYPVTNISNDADCGMVVTYLADSKNYIDNQLAIQAQAQEEALLNMLLLMPDSVQASMIENDTNNLLNEAEV